MPTAAHPTARCWTKSDLHDLFLRLAAPIGLPPQVNSLDGFLAYLHEVGWILPVPLDALTKAGPSGGFYLLDPSAAAQGRLPDPLELLQACQPGGVICYFSALVYHSLTTQVASHHHVTKLNPVSSRQSAGSQKTNLRRAKSAAEEHLDGATEESARGETTGADQPQVSRKRNLLGTEIFVYEGVPCYMHRRQAALLEGAQLRDVDARTRLRVTSREQTLLDTLQKPVACGGEAVVFEAWENGVGDLDEERLAKRLRASGHPLTLRRVGAMLERLGHAVGDELRTLLQEHQRSDEEQRRRLAPPVPSPSTPGDPAVTLLPGYLFSTLSPRWGVLVP